MRHPYFKDARESEAQKIQSESPRGISNNTSKSDTMSSKKSSLQNSAKQKALDGSSKMNAVINKALPSISAMGDEITTKPNHQVCLLYLIHIQYLA